MNNNISNIIKYMLNEKSTIRATAKHFKMPKSSLYDKVKRYMLDCDDEEYFNLIDLFADNKKHMWERGGKTFKEKYSGKKRIDIIKNKS